MKHVGTSPYLALALVAALLSGCASKPAEPTTADLMRGHASDEQESVDRKSMLAERWERGKKLGAEGSKRIQDGEERLQKAEREAEKARQQIERGKREITEGSKLVREAEQRFREEFPDMKLD